MPSTNNLSSVTVVMIVQSLPPMPSGGAEIQALRLSRILIKRGISVIFITPGVGKIKGFEEIEGIPVYRLHSVYNYLLDLLFLIQKKSVAPPTVIEFDDGKTINNVISRRIGWGARLRYRIFLLNAKAFLAKRKSEVNIIHSHTIEWPAYVAAVISKKFGKRLIVKDSTMNGITNILRYPEGAKKQQLIIERAEFVAMTKAIETNLLASGVGQQKITRIANGIDIDANAKTDYSGAKNVLFVGNLYQQPAKGIDILLKAWTLVSAKHREAILSIAGDGDLAAYHDFVRKLGVHASVQFLGKRSDIHALMQAADVFVLPSRREGMPNVLMEAMLRGLPCVATDISGSQDLVVDRETGLLVPPANPTALAEAVMEMLADRQEAERMGRNARKKIISEFDMEIIADRYIKLYLK